MLPMFALATALAFPVHQPATASQQGIDWVFDFAQATARAKAANKPVFLYLWAEGSGQSVKFFSETLADDQVVEVLSKGFVCCSAKTNDRAGYDLAQQFAVQAMPSSIVFGPDGAAEDMLAGFVPAADLLVQLDRIQRGDKTLSWYRKRAEADPDDLQARHDYAVQLDYLGDREAHDRLVDSIRAEDPDGRTEIGCRVALQDLQAEVFDGLDDVREADLGPIYAFVEKCRHQKLAFDVWNSLGNLEWSREDKLKARQNMVKAWETIPEGEVMDWGNLMAFRAWEQREDLPNQFRKLALKVATEATKRAEVFHEKRGEVDGQSDGDGGDGAQRSDEEWDRFLAGRLDTLAVCYHMNGKRALAIKTMQRCIELDPAEAIYKQRLEHFASSKR